MEEEFEKIEVEYAPLSGDDEFDDQYEFDAPQFCDFTQQETFWNGVEAEQWFEFAESYPPSPFLIELRRGNSVGMGNENAITENSTAIKEDDSHGTSTLSKSSSQSKSKDLSFMKPTASNLAKQKNLSEVHTTPPSSRFQRHNSSSTDCQLTKRQKLEAGYLRKVARLKHQSLFTHKKIEKGDRTDANLASKSNATIPKEPNLVTAQRAQRQSNFELFNRSRTNAESDGPTKSTSKEIKARPLPKKILDSSALFPKTKTPPRQTGFQEFHLRTSQRAMQHLSNNAGGSLNNSSISNNETKDPKRTTSSACTRQEKCKTLTKTRSNIEKQPSSKGERGVFRNIKVYPLEPNAKKSLNEPPTELFNKLSLASSEDKQTTKLPSKEQPNPKGLKENRPGSLHHGPEKMNLIKGGFQRPCGKHYQGVNEMGYLMSKQTCMLEIGH